MYTFPYSFTIIPLFHYFYIISTGNSVEFHMAYSIFVSAFAAHFFMPCVCSLIDEYVSEFACVLLTYRSIFSMNVLSKQSGRVLLLLVFS